MFMLWMPQLGSEIWNYSTGTLVTSSPAVVNGVVYIGGGSGNHVYALNATTGAYIWSYPTGDFVYSSPAVVNGVLFVGSNDGNVYALGSPTTPFPSPIITSPTPSSTTNTLSTPTSNTAVPELSWLAIVPLLLSLFSVAVVLNHRKTANLK